MIDTRLMIDHVNYCQLPNDDNTPIPTPLKIGTIYRFNKQGVELSQHRHSDERYLHYTIILDGEFEIARENKTNLIAKKHDFVDFSLHEPHSIICILPGVIFNGFKYGNTLDAIDSRIANARQELAHVAKDLLATVGSIYP